MATLNPFKTIGLERVHRIANGNGHNLAMKTHIINTSLLTITKS